RSPDIRCWSSPVSCRRRAVTRAVEGPSTPTLPIVPARGTGIAGEIRPTMVALFQYLLASRRRGAQDHCLHGRVDRTIGLRGEKHMSNALAEDVDITSPHTRREHAAASEEPLRRFAPTSSPLPPDFVEELLRGDDAYNPRLAYALAVIAGWSYSDAR